MKAKITIYLITGMFLLSVSCTHQHDKNSVTDSFLATNMQMNMQLQGPNENLLLGEWARTDSPYIIKITGVFNSDVLEAGYFDPKPINIEEVNWNKTGIILSVYLKLRDTNYPGSNYKLNYVPQRDKLVGEYYEAVECIYYPVEFSRTK